MTETAVSIKTEVAPFPDAGPLIWRGIIIKNGEILFSWFIIKGRHVKCFLENMPKFARARGFSEGTINELREKLSNALSG